MGDAAQQRFEQIQREKIQQELAALAGPPAMGTRARTSARRRAIEQLGIPTISPKTQRRRALSLLTRPGSVLDFSSIESSGTVTPSRPGSPTLGSNRRRTKKKAGRRRKTRRH